MKIKLLDIVEYQKNMGALTKVKLPVKVAYRISKLNIKIASEVKDYKEQEFNLIKDLGEVVLDTEGKETDNLRVTKENMPKYKEEVEKLLDLEVELDFEPIDINELGETTIEPSLLNPIFFKE